MFYYDTVRVGSTVVAVVHCIVWYCDYYYCAVRVRVQVRVVLVLQKLINKE